MEVKLHEGRQDFTITDHKLDGVRYAQAADQGGVLVDPLYVMFHYTGGTNDSAALVTLTRKDDNYVSPHVIVERDGDVIQCVRFDRQAWHAGQSAWQGRKRLNHCAFGIELVNPGYERPELGKLDPSKWPTVEAFHKHGGVKRKWYRYSPAQLESAVRVATALFRYYGSVRECVGHDDVARGRKLDPGPAFPWWWVRNEIRVRKAEAA